MSELKKRKGLRLSAEDRVKPQIKIISSFDSVLSPQGSLLSFRLEEIFEMNDLVLFPRGVPGALDF